MTPAKKAASSVPSLSDLMKNDPKDTENTENMDSDESTVDPDVEVPDGNLDSEGNLVVPVDDPVVPIWEENHMHNLGKIHPDVVESGPTSEQATVMRTVHTAEYADVNPNDDKGLTGNDEVIEQEDNEE